ncbi:signal peptide peptidase SppA [bacterium]|nr:signal peptide peptidase SppA [bacterium]
MLVGFVSILFYWMDDGKGFIPGGSVAVVKIEGPIFDSKETLEDLNKYRKNRSVKAVVLRIDSPGGAVAPSQEIFEEVKKLKQDKKVVVSMGTMAASGGYYISCAADYIMAMKGTITGSIGVIMESLGVNRLAEWAMLESRVIKTGKFKDVGSPMKPMDDEDRAYLQSILNNMYTQFKGDVGEGRKMTPEQVEELAQGKVYTGEQAKALGLIDGLGTIYDAIDQAKKMAGLSQDAHVVWPRKKENPLDFLAESKWMQHFLSIVTNKLEAKTEPQWMYLYSPSVIH